MTTPLVLLLHINADPPPPSTPELRGTIIDNLDQHRPTSICRPGPFKGGQATSQHLANMAQQVGRITMAQTLFESTSEEASWALFQATRRIKIRCTEGLTTLHQATDAT